MPNDNIERRGAYGGGKAKSNHQNSESSENNMAAAASAAAAGIEKHNGEKYRNLEESGEK